MRGGTFLASVRETCNRHGCPAIVGLTMGDEPSFYSPLQAFFGQTLVEWHFVYIDVWSAVHLVSGIVIGAVLARRLRPAWALGWSTTILLAYEVAELGLDEIVFVPETPVDMLWDLIVGFVGVAVGIGVVTGRTRGSRLVDTPLDPPSRGKGELRRSSSKAKELRG